ncbi:MAG TPA: hypothetical protein VKS82_15960 [Streptosporangiaceae bacterium]|nr:hypothetical protein [Streptosporangiaceae bacterium]
MTAVRITRAGSLILKTGALTLVAGGLVPAALAVGVGPASAASRQAGQATAAGVISAIAGGVGGPGLARKVSLVPYTQTVSNQSLCGVSYHAGVLYLGAGNMVRSVDTQTDMLGTPAGIGSAGPVPRMGSPAKKAAMQFACGTAADSSGNLLIANADARRLEVVPPVTGTFYGQAMTAGHLYSIAGDGTAGFSGDGGPATAAELGYPSGVTVDAVGNVVIADIGSDRIRVVAERTGTFYGQAMTAGDIYTIAGDGAAGFSGDGGPATAAGLNLPGGVAVDAAGNVLIADTYNQRVRVVAASAGTFYGQAMTAGDIYTIAGTGHSGDSGNTGLATQATLDYPPGVAVDGAGNVAIADFSGDIRVVAVQSGQFYRAAMTAGHIYLVAGNRDPGFSGNGVPALHAEMGFPLGLAMDGAGNLLTANSNRVRVIAHIGGTFYGQAMRAGHIYTIAGDAARGYSGDGGPATSASFYQTWGLALDPAGNVVVVDNADQRVRVVAEHTGTFYGRTMTAGDVYTVAGDGTAGFSGDGGPATAAELNYPAGVTVDAAGNLLIADAGNSRIRVVAEHTGTFYGQAMTAGDIYTIVGTGTAGFSGDGGPATAAKVSNAEAVKFDAAGDLVIADFNNNRIRVVAEHTGTFYGQAMTAGDIYTIAGRGFTGRSGDGGLATKALLSNPEDVAVDAAGNVLIADTGNSEVRVVAESTGTFYGKAMTAGRIYAFAGYGPYGFTGDGGRAVFAELEEPAGLLVTPAGNVLISDTANGRIREVTG